MTSQDDNGKKKPNPIQNLFRHISPPKKIEVEKPEVNTGSPIIDPDDDGFITLPDEKLRPMELFKLISDLDINYMLTKRFPNIAKGRVLIEKGNSGEDFSIDIQDAMGIYMYVLLHNVVSKTDVAMLDIYCADRMSKENGLINKVLLAIKGESSMIGNVVSLETYDIPEFTRLLNAYYATIVKSLSHTGLSALFGQIAEIRNNTFFVFKENGIPKELVELDDQVIFPADLIAYYKRNMYTLRNLRDTSLK